MAEFFAFEGTALEDEAIRALVRSGYDASEIAAQLRAGRVYPDDVTPGWSIHWSDPEDGKTRPFQLYVPGDYNPKRAHPVIVYLHGGIGYLCSVEGLVSQRAIWEETADQLGAILIMPHGDVIAAWWNRIGLACVNEALRCAKRQCNVDENRVFLNGFSDGGSGTFWIAMHDPTPWAGFLAWHGDPSVVAGMSYECFPLNLVNRPLLVVNGLYDQLYPATVNRTYVEQIRELGGHVEWEVRAADHEFEAYSPRKPRSDELVEKTVRDPYPAIVVWETSTTAAGRCDWVRIDRIGRCDVDAPSMSNLLFTQAATSLGLLIDEHTQDGALVRAVQRGFAADRCGVAAGDVIRTVNGVDAISEYSIKSAVRGAAPGVPVRIEVARGQGSAVLSATFPEPFPVYRRDRPAARLVATATGNRIEVSATNVKRFSLFLSSQQFDLDQAIEVLVDGEPTFEGIVEPDVEFMLEQAAMDVDRQAVYEARLEIRI